MDTMAGWEGEELAAWHDRRTGAWTMVAIHSTALGPAVGGTRIGQYESADRALTDVLRLAQGMTFKTAVAGLPCGGGKAVISIPPAISDADRRRLLLRYAEFVESLGGRFVTGPDMNTGQDDMDLIGRVTEHVFCRSPQAGGSGSASPWTAMGVFHGIRASVRQVFATDDLIGLRVVVQGVGEVGAKLARLLHSAGARVVLSDVAHERVSALVAELETAEFVAPELALVVDCDVISPCAMGAVVNERSVAQLRCRIVAGAANNQLATAEDGERLRRRGILYAPDYVINAGGIIRGVGAETLHWTDSEIDRRVEAIGETLREIYSQADSRSIPTDEAARGLAEEALLAAA